MSVDEALLLEAGVAGPVLRLYGWRAPRSRSATGRSRRPGSRAARELGVEVVRRVTGGGAVLHAADLTYAVIAPLGTPRTAATIWPAATRGSARGCSRDCSAAGFAARAARARAGADAARALLRGRDRLRGRARRAEADRQRAAAHAARASCSTARSGSRTTPRCTARSRAAHLRRARQPGLDAERPARGAGRRASRRRSAAARAGGPVARASALEPRRAWHNAASTASPRRPFL